MSSSSSSTDGIEGDLIDAFQAEYEEEMLNEEEEPRRPRRRREFIRRDRLGASDRLFEDYFADDCNYPPSFFRRRGEAPVVNFTVNGHEYNYGYYLANGIYPSWPVFMNGVTLPQSEKQRMFTAAQAAWRKDVERAFGVLKARFNILAVPGCSYSRRTLGLIMRACIILHNMIIDDERGTNLEHTYETVESNVGPAIHHHAPPSLAARIQMDNEMRDSPVYTQLQQDLIEHEWEKTPTAELYADGQMSGPSAYGLAGAAQEADRRRVLTVGVEVATPRAAVGVNLALGVAPASPALAPAPSLPAHGVTQTPRATLGIGHGPPMPTATLGI
ncbi:hypothetical protein QYE76_034314 [Lolium multiflorum]|uniref:Nuclease HARBI1 n=1 Tax=Lolium multiflorum TaxID=4521 RepID=A0AAD8VME6_LOLMU|nr:hypothetical protein QYE76_034314 [Lolium multiflorum]